MFFLFLFKLVFVLTCSVLIVLILLQHGKGGGLAGMLGGAGGSEAFIGPGGASKMAKITVLFAVLFFGLCLAHSVIRPPEAGSIIESIRVDEAPVPLSDVPVSPEDAGEGAPAGPEGPGAEPPLPGRVAPEAP